MVERRWCPGRFAVTGSAIGRELCRSVVWIGGGGIIGCVATVASVRCVVVIAVVASSTVAGNGRMCPVKRIEIVVYRECSGLPTRGSGVAGGTVSRQAQCAVVGVGAGIVIRCVAPRAGIGRIGIIAVVASVAVVCNGYVGSSKRIHCIVIKRRRRPGRFSVAGSAIRREM